MNFLHDLFMNVSHARAVSIGLALIMGMLLLSPLSLCAFYLLFRPLVQPYAYHQYTIFAGVPLTAIFSVILIIMAYFNGLFRPDHTLRNKQLWPLYLLLLLSTLSFLNTTDYMISLGGVLKLLTAIAMYILVYNSVWDEKDVKKILLAYVICTIIPMLFGYYQYVTGTGHAWKAVYYAGKRIDSFLGEWNEYGIFLCMALAAGLMYLNLNISRNRRLMVICAMGSMLASLMLSLNRGSWISLTLGVVIASLVFYRRVKLQWLVGVVLVITLMFGGVIYKRFVELEQTTEIGASQNTLKGRIEGWRELWPMIKAHPLTGNGLDVSSRVTKKETGQAFFPHNDYLRMALEAGIPASLLYILFIVIEIFRAFRRRNDTSTWPVNYALLITTVYFLVISAVQNISMNVIIFPMFMGLLAIGHKFDLLTRPEAN